MLNIRLEGKLPIYEQLYNGISRLISSGELEPDERLPAVREVAKQFGINPNTVQKSYSQLEQAGLIYSIPAKGSYVSGGGDAAEAVRKEAVRNVWRELRSCIRRRGQPCRDRIPGTADMVRRGWRGWRNRGNW